MSSKFIGRYTVSHNTLHCKNACTTPHDYPTYHGKVQANHEEEWSTPALMMKDIYARLWLKTLDPKQREDCGDEDYDFEGSQNE